jgi:hypothetical protein
MEVFSRPEGPALEALEEEWIEQHLCPGLVTVHKAILEAQRSAGSKRKVKELLQLKECSGADLYMHKTYLRVLPLWLYRQGADYPLYGLLQPILKHPHWPAYRDRLLWCSRCQARVGAQVDAAPAAPCPPRHSAGSTLPLKPQAPAPAPAQSLSLGRQAVRQAPQHTSSQAPGPSTSTSTVPLTLQAGQVRQAGRQAGRPASVPHHVRRVDHVAQARLQLAHGAAALLALLLGPVRYSQSTMVMANVQQLPVRDYRV